jgi:hypothetical protein
MLPKIFPPAWSTGLAGGTLVSNADQALISRLINARICGGSSGKLAANFLGMLQLFVDAVLQDHVLTVFLAGQCALHQLAQ